MKKFNIILCLISLSLLGCNKIDRLIGNTPYLDLSNSEPYELKISEFKWGYGMVEFNKFSGDFEELDEKVFELLKDKEGTVKVYLESSEKDHYGKDQDSTVNLGEISLSELNKYDSWEFWHKNSGIKALLYKKYVQLEPVVKPTPLEPTIYQPEQSTELKTFSLKHTELYPDETDRASHDFQSYTEPISGVIEAADFYHGTLEVQGDDGEYYALMIQPDDLPTSSKSDVRYFMKPGNRIACVCTLAGARELIIVSATFTSKK